MSSFRIVWRAIGILLAVVITSLLLWVGPSSKAASLLEESSAAPSANLKSVVRPSTGNPFDLTPTQRRRRSRAPGGSLRNATLQSLDFTRTRQYTSHEGPFYNMTALRLIRAPESSAETLVTFLLRCLRQCAQHRGEGCSHVIRAADGERCWLKRGGLKPLPPGASSATDQSIDETYVAPVSLQSGGAKRPRLVFGMLAGDIYSDTRVTPMLRTYLRDEAVVLLIENSSAGRKVVDVMMGRAPTRKFRDYQRPERRPSTRPDLPDGIPPNCTLDFPNPYGGEGHVWVRFMPPPPRPTDASFNGAWKDFDVMEAMHELVPFASHYIVVDDDTFMLPEPLRYVASFMDAQFPVITGLLVYSRGTVAQAGDRTYADINQRANFTAANAAFLADEAASGIGIYRDNARHASGPSAPKLIPNIQGGAGIVMTSAALKALLQHMPECRRSCRQWAGDVRVGCCAEIARVRLQMHESFFLHDDFTALEVSRDLHVAYPVSFHDVRTPEMIYPLWNLCLSLRACQPRLSSNFSRPYAPLTTMEMLTMWQRWADAWRRKHPSWVVHRRPFHPVIVVA